MRILLAAALALPLPVYAQELPPWLAAAAPELALPGRWTELRSIWSEADQLIQGSGDPSEHPRHWMPTYPRISDHAAVAALLPRLRRAFDQPEALSDHPTGPVSPQGVDSMLAQALYHLLTERLVTALYPSGRTASRMALPRRGTRAADLDSLEARLDQLEQLRSLSALDAEAYQAALLAAASQAARVLSWRLLEADPEDIAVAAGLRLSLTDSEHILPVFDAVSQALLARIPPKEQTELIQTLAQQRAHLELLIAVRPQLPALLDALTAP